MRNKMKKKSEGVDTHQKPISPEEIVKEANRLCNEVLRPVIANIDKIQWMRANGWLNIECKVEATSSSSRRTSEGNAPALSSSSSRGRNLTRLRIATGPIRRTTRSRRRTGSGFARTTNSGSPRPTRREV